MQHRYTPLAVFVFVACMLSAACKKMVDVKSSDDKLPTDKLFADEKQALGALMAAYGELTAAPLYFSNAGMVLFTGLTADELVVGNSTSSSFHSFAKNDIDPNDDAGLGRNLWGAAYRTIGITNNILEGLAGSPLPDSVKLPMRGEALSLRAWTYFCLINLFGDVPLITSTNVAQNNAAARTGRVQVYALIISNLEEAVKLLPEAFQGKDRMRMNRAVAYCMLAKFSLFNERWQIADHYSTLVLDDERFQLESLPDVFKMGSREVIWQLVARPDAPSATAMADLFIPGKPAIAPSFQISASLLNAFEPGDLRKNTWIDGSKAGEQISWFPCKYKQKGGAPWQEAQAVIRVPEMLLIRAEARANMGMTRQATDDINAIRERAGLEPIRDMNRNRLLKVVMQERRTELMCEGHRWMDLKRTGQIDSVLKPLKGNSWQPEDQWYPLPASQLKNGNLTQNPGYP